MVLSRIVFATLTFAVFLPPCCPIRHAGHVLHILDLPSTDESTLRNAKMRAVTANSGLPLAIFVSFPRKLQGKRPKHPNSVNPLLLRNCTENGYPVHFGGGGSDFGGYVFIPKHL